MDHAQRNPTSKPWYSNSAFNTIKLKRVGELTLSDRFPALEWESPDRSPLILQLRKNIADGQPMTVVDFWRNVEKTGTP